MPLILIKAVQLMRYLYSRPPNLEALAFSNSTVKKIKSINNVFFFFCAQAECFIIMRRLGREPTRKQVREMIEDVDDNGNGQIEFDEFVLLMRKLFPERDDKPKWRGVLGGLGRVFSKVDTFDKTKVKKKNDCMA